MADRLSNFSSSSFAYANYWRPSVSLGSTMPHPISSKMTDKLSIRHKWQIVSIATCVVIAVTLMIGIYNAVLYQKSSTTLFLTTTSDTTTTAAATSTAAATITADSVTTISSTTTTTITTLAVDTTSAAVSTEVVTTKTSPVCPSMLPFGDDAGDELHTNMFNILFSCMLWGNKVDNASLRVRPLYADIALQSDNGILFEVRVIYDFDKTTPWRVYHRNVSSKADQDAIACLVNNSQTSNTAVFTWINPVATELQAIQIIIASFGQSATYLIRIYSDNLPDSKDYHPVDISYSDDKLELSFFPEGKIKDVAGKRQIFEVSKNWTVVEEGKNCDVFIC